MARSLHPALETLDASGGGVRREAFEPTVMWLAIRGGLSGEVEISPPNGRPACSSEVVNDLFRALSDGLVRLDGEDFVLTRSGVDFVARSGCRAAPAARELLASAPNRVDELLAAVAGCLKS